ncbi:MAG TPA: DUF3566 domain-containing protein [Nocardioidaceae bacterium]|nr:DUF3566 domain-containing protein [Nocardioidaceae bacterium]
MADRRAEERPLAPRRSLSGPSASPAHSDTDNRSFTERVTAAASAAGSAVSQAANAGSTAMRNKAAEARDARDSREPRERPPRSSASRPPARRPRGSRRARLRLVHLDPWSVMKTSFLLSIALGIVIVVAVAVVWSVLGAAGVWESINRTVGDVMGGSTAQSFDVRNYVGTSRVLGFTMIVAVVDVVLVTAIATLGAFLYNLAAALLGGIEVTLAEDDR